MSPIVYALLALVAVFFLYRAARRTRTLAIGEIERGSLRVTRGRIPPACLADLREVIARGKVRAGSFEIRKEDGRPFLEGRGLDETIVQRLRNVVGQYELAKFR